jgi:quercetin dioxygenase-like cupin family protein
MLATTFDRPERDRWFLGTWLRLIADATDTGGALAVMEQRAPRGFSPPRHIHHDEDTAMLVLSGEMTVEIGAARQVCGPGGFVWLPRDVPHTFRVDSDEVHLLEFVTPAGMEQFHVDASEPAARPAVPPPGPPDIARLVQAIEPYRAEIVGPPLHVGG